MSSLYSILLAEQQQVCVIFLACHAVQNIAAICTEVCAVPLLWDGDDNIMLTDCQNTANNDMAAILVFEPEHCAS